LTDPAELMRLLPDRQVTRRAVTLFMRTIRLAGVVQIRVTRETWNPLVGAALATIGVTHKPPVLNHAPVAPSRTGVRGRVATVALRAGPVVICRPRHGHDLSAPPQLKLTMVEAREVDGPGDGQPLLWRLLTTLDVADAAGAAETVRLYRLRWRIEEIFRSLKADGMRLEDTQMQDAGRLFKLALVGLAAATRTMQLVDARDGSPRPATDVIDASVLPAAEAIARTLEGKTARQQNPHPRQSLAWLSWIIARLGGWNCYYKPPGPKTMRAGWAQFVAMAAGFALAAQSNV